MKKKTALKCTKAQKTHLRKLQAAYKKIDTYLDQLYTTARAMLKHADKLMCKKNGLQDQIVKLRTSFGLSIKGWV